MKNDRRPPDAQDAADALDGPQSLVDEAVEVIRNRILDLTLPPGHLVNSTTLVKDLGLGRTPVREALNRLAAEGLLRFAANQGVYVTPLDLIEVNDLFEAFRVCEQIAARFCNTNAPNLLSDLVKAQEMQRAALHRHAYLEASHWNARQRLVIAETCSNRHLLDFYRKTANQIGRLSVLVYQMEAVDPDFYLRQARLLEEMHADVRKAVEKRDRDLLRTTIVNQVDIFQDRVSNLLKRQRARDLELG